MGYDNQLRTNKDKIRFLVGDTDILAEIFSDEEINATLTVNTQHLGRSSAAVARAIAAKFARRPDFKASRVSASNSQLFSHYMKLAKELERRPNPLKGRKALPVPQIGNVFTTDNQTLADDPSLTQPAFKRGMDDHPRTITEVDDIDDEEQFV